MAKFNLLRGIQTGAALGDLNRQYQFRNALEGFQPGGGLDQNALTSAMRIDPERAMQISAFESGIQADRKRKEAYVMARAKESFESLKEMVGSLDPESPTLKPDFRQILETHERLYPDLGFMKEPLAQAWIEKPKPIVQIYNRLYKGKDKPAVEMKTIYGPGGLTREIPIEKGKEYTPPTGWSLKAPSADKAASVEMKTIYGPGGQTKEIPIEKGKEYTPPAGWSLKAPSADSSGAVKIGEMKTGIDSILGKYKIDAGINLNLSGDALRESFLAGKKNAYQILQEKAQAGDKQAARDLERVMILYEQMWAFLQQEGEVSGPAAAQPDAGQVDLSRGVPSHTPLPGSPAAAPPGGPGQTSKRLRYDVGTGRFTQ